MGPLSKTLFALVLLLPGGLIAAPALWWLQRRRALRMTAPHIEA